MAKFWQSKISSYNKTGSGAMSTTLAVGMKFEIISIRLHLSAAGGALENFTATLASDTNAVYNIVFVAENMNAAADIVSMPDISEGWVCEKLDDVVFAYANSNSRTWGLEVKYRKIS